MFVNRIDEMGAPYISIPKGHSLQITFIPTDISTINLQYIYTSGTNGATILVTGEKIYPSGSVNV
jgi:hypothetical protein